MITKEMLKAIAPASRDTVVDPLIENLNKYFPKYEVNSWLRVCHFLAQAAHESDSFKTLEEYASGKAYEGRKDLGNVNKGDGMLFKGRGIFQLTGRSNYKTMGDKLGIDLVSHPNLAKEADVSVLTALEYWKSRGLNKFADADDVTTITKKINGGLNGFDARKTFLARAKKVIPNDVAFDVPTPVPAPIPPDLLLIIVAKKGDNSPYVGDIQNLLIRKGWSIASDGIFGSKTETAVKEFQQKNGLPVTGSVDTDTLNKLMV